MAKKRTLKKGASNNKGRKRYFNGGQAYALPTSAAATTSNMMGMGDPAQLQKNLQMANAMATEQQQRIKAQEEMRTAAAGEQSKANLANAQAQAQGVAGSTGLALGKHIKYGIQTAKDASKTVGSGIKAGLKAAGPNAAAGLGGAGLGLAGAGIKHASNDDDATTMNFGESAGTLMQGAGTGLGLAGTLGLMGAVPGVGWAAAGLGALGYGIHGLVQRNKARVEQQKIDEQNAIARNNMSQAQQQAFNKNFVKQGSDIGYNVGNAMTNSYTPSQQTMFARDGGKKVPGGEVVPLGGNAVEFKGASHDNGGILIDPQTEVEGGETMDQVEMKEGGMSEYIFSDHLKLGGKSFGQRHKEILKRGGGQREIQNLAKLQELVASKKAQNPEGRTPEKIMRNGGPVQYRDGDEPKNRFNTYNPYGFGRAQDWAYTAQTPGMIDYEGVIGGRDYGSIPNSTFGQFYNAPVVRDPQAAAAIGEGGMEQLYDDVYLDRAREFYQDSPDQAYSWLQTMFNSNDPQAVMFKRKLADENGNILPKEEALKIAEDLSTDKKVGPFHLYLRPQMEELTPVGLKPIGNRVERELNLNRTEIPEKEIPEKERTPIKLPRWSAALLGLAGLQQNGLAPGPRTISPQTQRGVNLPRVNMNAERAANSAMSVGTNRQLANQLSGPAGAAAMLAANQQARAQGLNIGNQEARANKELMAQEAGMNANIAGSNTAAVNQANMFNAQALRGADLERYQQDILDRQRNKDVFTGVAKDAMQYAAQERYANALDAFHAYQRYRDGEKSEESDGTAADKATKAQKKTVETATGTTPPPKVKVTTSNSSMVVPGLLPAGTSPGWPGFDATPVSATNVDPRFDATPANAASANVDPGFDATPTPTPNSNPTAMMFGMFPQQNRYGGYVRRSNKINRKRRK